MNAEDANQIDVEHTPDVVYGLGGGLAWVCGCGSSWPCRQLQLADDARQRQARIARAQRDRSGNGS
jgi:hypothetical protein